MLDIKKKHLIASCKQAYFLFIGSSESYCDKRNACVMKFYWTTKILLLLVHACVIITLQCIFFLFSVKNQINAANSFLLN